VQAIRAEVADLGRWWEYWVNKTRAQGKGGIWTLTPEDILAHANNCKWVTFRFGTGP